MGFITAMLILFAAIVGGGVYFTANKWGTGAWIAFAAGLLFYGWIVASAPYVERLFG